MSDSDTPEHASKGSLKPVMPDVLDMLNRSKASPSPSSLSLPHVITTDAAEDNVSVPDTSHVRVRKGHGRTLSSILVTSAAYDRIGSPLGARGDGDGASIASSGRNSVHFTISPEAQMSLENIVDFEPLDPNLPEMEGTLMKWTNYIGGWQERWVELRDGNIYYYRSRDEMDNCRGSVDLEEAIVSAHEFDELRFDVSLKDTTFYFRCPTKNEAENWLDALEQTKIHYKDTLIEGCDSPNEAGQANGFEGMGNVTATPLRRRPSVSSLASVASFKIKAANEKLKELDAYSEAMVVMQKKVIAAVEEETDLSENIKDSMASFETTTTSLLDTLDAAISLLYAFEDDMHLRLVRERDIRRKLKYQVKQLRREKQQWESERAGYKNGDQQQTSAGAHGRNSDNDSMDGDAIEGGVFFDALEDTKDDWSDNTRDLHQATQEITHDSMKLAFIRQTNKRVDRILAARAEDSPTGSDWEVVRQTNTVSVHRHDVEVADDQIDDFVKAHTVINGVTAAELSEYFFDVNYRSDWEGIHEHHKILDDLGDEMVVINQAYTRLWPAAQRDCTYLTSRRRVDDTDIYAVINYSVNHPDDHIPASFVRASAEVGMVCESVIRPQCTETSLDALTRQDIQTKIYYQAKISPGGWVPAAVVRETSKREYPKFLHQLGKGCTEHFSDRPLDCSTVKKAFESRPPPAE